METTLKLLLRKKSGQLAKILVFLMRRGFTVQHQEMTDTMALDQSLLTIQLANGSITTEDLIGELFGLTDVLEIDGEKPDVDQLEVKNEYLTPEIIASKFPNFIQSMREFEQNIVPDKRDDSMFNLGEQVGTLVYQEEYSNLYRGDSIQEAFKKIIGPVISTFAINEIRGSELRIVVCPVCRDQISKQVFCHFLSGFISGLLNSVPEIPSLIVSETTCQAMGDDSCTFVGELQS